MNHLDSALVLAAAAGALIAVAAALATGGMRLMTSERAFVWPFGVSAVVAATTLLSTASIAAWGCAAQIALAIQ